MTRALGALTLGVGLAAIAVLFATASLYVPAVALILVAGASAVWVLLAAAGAGITREPGPPTVAEDAPYPVGMLLRTGLLPAPGGVLFDPLLDAPMPIAGMSSRRIRIDVCFPRRGRRTIEPGELRIADPLGLATRTVGGGGEPVEVLVLPRVMPVTAPDGGGDTGAGSAAEGRSAATALRGRLDGSAAELDLDGLRAYRTGTPASRIHWPALARSGEMLERRLTAESDGAPLVVLDTSEPPSEAALDAAVRAVASLCVHLAGRGGCALLLPGDRRPASIGADLAGWPALHIRLALIEAGRARPRLARARRSGMVLWVSARPDPPRDLARASAGARLVTPSLAAGHDGDPDFLVAGCAGRRIGRRARTGAGAVA